MLGSPTVNMSHVHEGADTCTSSLADFHITSSLTRTSISCFASRSVWNAPTVSPASSMISNCEPTSLIRYSSAIATSTGNLLSLDGPGGTLADKSRVRVALYVQYSGMRKYE